MVGAQIIRCRNFDWNTSLLGKLLFNDLFYGLGNVEDAHVLETAIEYLVGNFFIRRCKQEFAEISVILHVQIRPKLGSTKYVYLPLINRVIGQNKIGRASCRERV